MRFPFPPHEPDEPIVATPAAEAQPPTPDAETTVGAPVMTIMATAEVEATPPANDDFVAEAALQSVVEMSGEERIS